MIISSELTGKTYKTVEECLAAEKEFEEKRKADEERKRAHKEACDKAYDEAMAACNKYLELIGVDVEHLDNGYRVTYKNKNSKADEIFEDIMNELINW